MMNFNLLAAFCSLIALFTSTAQAQSIQINPANSSSLTIVNGRSIKVEAGKYTRSFLVAQDYGY